MWQKADAENTPIDADLSDIKPTIRAELKRLNAALPEGADQISRDHFTDLHERIGRALSNASYEAKSPEK